MVSDRFQEALSLHRAGYVERAEGIYRDLLCETPGHAGAWHLLGMVLYGRRDLAGALEHVGKALSLCDSKAVYWNNYGAVLKDLERHEEAKAAFEKAIRIRDDYADAWSNLGLMQTELGLLEEAEKSIRYALRLEPRHADALSHLASVFRERGQLEEALRLCRDAIAVASEKAEVHRAEGDILTAMRRYEEAAGAYDRALFRDPLSDDTHLRQGHALADNHETRKAKESYRRAAELRPDRPVWRLRHLSLCPAVFESADEIAHFRVELEGQLDEALADPPSFDWRLSLQDGFAPSFQLAHHGMCNRRIKEKHARLFAGSFSKDRPKPKKRERLRVGFTCTSGHEGGFLRGFGGILQRLDRRRFDVYGLVSQDILSRCRTQVRCSDVTWIGFPHHMERAFGAFRHADCDVVVHWQAGTSVMNYFLPFLPLAPVQCIGFGQHGTTGVSNIDYFVSSRLFERGAAASEDYTETLVQFTGSTAWQPRPPNPPPARRTEFGLPESGVLYFCPQRHVKFHPHFDRILRAILERDRAGHAVILQGHCRNTAEALRTRLAASLGSTLARRVLFVPSQEPSGYYRLLRTMDVVLDTPSYSASLTGYDAFHFGIPVVTLPGPHMVQRYALGLYTVMGIRDLVTDGEAEYVDLAVRLGLEDDFRQAMGQAICERNETLYDNHSVIHEYEDFLQQAACSSQQSQ